MSAPRTPGSEGDQPPQPVLPPVILAGPAGVAAVGPAAAEMAAQPAPAPAADADAVEQFRTTLGDFMQTEESIVIPDNFAIEGARVGLEKLHAPPPPGVLVAPQPAALPGAAQGAPNAMSPADYAAAVARFQRFEQFLQMEMAGALPPQS